MKVSLKWLNDYLNTSLDPLVIEKELTSLGLECKIIKTDFNFSKKVVLGKVIDIKKHPNADKLKICLVNVGEKDLLSIVCGAPNVKKDILVPVALIGSTLGKEKFKISKTKIRGEFSFGMICSEKELSIGENHDGIMIFKCKKKLGTSVENILEKNDYLYDIDLTPNRGDCLGHLGVARELSIIENKKISLQKISLLKSKFTIDDEIKIKNHTNNACLRYCSIVIKNVKVSKSPLWLIEKLDSIGQKSINNVVDIANYILNDLGHPLHTFDLDLLKGKKINVRYAKDNEKIIGLDNVNYKLNTNDLVIADSDSPVAIAGIIGGLNSHVTNDTKNILIESAYFDPVTIRKTSKRLGVSTDASKRFERDTDYEILIYAMNKAAMLIRKVAGGEISKDFIDINLSSYIQPQISFNSRNCNDFLGSNISIKEFKTIFNKLSISFSNKNNNFVCSIPSYRNDLNNEIDLYEEVARVYGYDNIISNNSFNIPSSSFIYDESKLESGACSILTKLGFNEHYSNSLYSKIDISINDKRKPVELINPLNQDMKYLRNDLLPGLLKSISYNEKRGQSFLKIFEVGSSSIYNKKEYNNTSECRELGIIWTLNKTKHWKYPQINDIYTIKGEIFHLLKMLNFDNIKIISNSNNNIIINKLDVGSIIQVSNDIKNMYNIKNDICFCKINFHKLSQVLSNENKFQKNSNFPSIIRDISILINKKYSYSDITDSILQNGGKHLTNVNLFDVYVDNKTSDKEHSLSYSLKFSSKERTLKDKEIDVVINKIINLLKKKYHVLQR